jgi:hypothetical protein
MSSGFRFRMIANAASQACLCLETIGYYLLFLEGKSTCNACPGNRMEHSLARAAPRDPRASVWTAIWGSDGSLRWAALEPRWESNTARHQVVVEAYLQQTQGHVSRAWRRHDPDPSALCGNIEAFPALDHHGPSSSAIGSHVG